MKVCFHNSLSRILILALVIIDLCITACSQRMDGILLVQITFHGFNLMNYLIVLILPCCRLIILQTAVLRSLMILVPL